MNAPDTRQERQRLAEVAEREARSVAVSEPTLPPPASGDDGSGDDDETESKTADDDQEPSE